MVKGELKATVADDTIIYMEYIAALRVTPASVMWGSRPRRDT